MEKTAQLSVDSYSLGSKLLSTQFPDGKINTKFDYDYLSDIPDAVWRLGVKRIIEEYEYKQYPSIATIRKFCGVDLESVTRYAIEVKLKGACRIVSDFNSLSFTDRALNLVCNTWGGHSVIKQFNEQDWLFHKKAMKELYSASVRSNRGDDRVKGIHEKQLSIMPHEFRIAIIYEKGEKIKYIDITQNRRLKKAEDKKYLNTIGLLPDKNNKITEIASSIG